MDDDLVKMHIHCMSEWPLGAIASQMHQHLQQVITHLSTMSSHYNPPPEKKTRSTGVDVAGMQKSLAISGRITRYSWSETV